MGQGSKKKKMEWRKGNPILWEKRTKVNVFFARPCFLIWDHFARRRCFGVEKSESDKQESESEGKKRGEKRERKGEFEVWSILQMPDTFFSLDL